MIPAWLSDLMSDFTINLFARYPTLYIPIIIVLVIIFYHFLNPLYTGTIYKAGDNRTSKWNQTVDGENDPRKAEDIY